MSYEFGLRKHFCPMICVWLAQNNLNGMLFLFWLEQTQFKINELVKVIHLEFWSTQISQKNKQ